MNENFSVDLYASKGTDGSLLLDIHPDDKGWFTPNGQLPLPVLPLFPERFPCLCGWITHQLDANGGGALQLASFTALNNPDRLVQVAKPDPANVPHEEMEKFLSDTAILRYARAGWHWTIMSNISDLARLGDLPESYRDDLIRYQKQMQIVLACLKAKVASC